MPTSYRSISETAAAWQCSIARVRQWCAQGRIPGAVRIGKFWAIPADAVRPAALRPGQLTYARPE